MYFLYLRIEGKNLDFKHISETINICGAKCVHKEMYDVWQAGIEIAEKANINEKVVNFIDKLYEIKQFIIELAENANLSLWLNIYADDMQINVNIPRDAIKKICQLSLSFDISIMNLGDFYMA